MPSRMRWRSSARSSGAAEAGCSATSSRARRSALKAQLAEECPPQHAEEERTGRLDERRLAQERSEAACDELREAAARQQQTDRETIASLQAEVAAKAAAPSASNSGDTAAGGRVAAVKRELQVAQSEKDTLVSKVAALERRLKATEDTEELLRASQRRRSQGYSKCRDARRQ